MGTLYITGAGVSSDSGIPTFRGADGFWTIGMKTIHRKWQLDICI